ncbi:hypothetical protein [Aurantiacibacter rhizosphaerae]|uniref:Uncharacterized protein n=1 Tax=Aurantiacibacter rhizosphaerae TaxID=2691582 RepID=A0A844XD21_9SPHN|nr:hypothetical protein [Aurantiacibacter rhizosphaerae]MWV27508.1 hypothetical protein [Aurantiacibacter rhizosphaerae]
MPKAVSKIARRPVYSEADAPPQKVNFLVGVVAFVGAIGVVGIFGLASIGGGMDGGDTGPHVIYEGGAPQRVEQPRENIVAMVDDDYVVGNFGDPVSDLYADDDDGGWGTPALERASDSGAGSAWN